MSSEDVSTLALAPFVRVFVCSAIKSIRHKNLSGQKYVLHADMVPRVTEKVMMASMGKRLLPPSREPVSEMSVPAETFPESKVIPKPLKQESLEVDSKSSGLLQQDVLSIMGSESSLPKQKPVLPAPPIQSSQFSNKPLRREPLRVIPPRNVSPVQQMVMPVAPVSEGEELTQFYGKISPLLSDSSITVIECPGVGKPVMIVRRGQRQPTKIILDKKEIDQILQKVSDAAHIPLMDGVFRAAVDIFSINAVISDIIGSRFVIKVQPRM
ncbi:hypothetical protein KAS08_05245 [Candidatus Pacearchaeota archaeon]|nr:hypothetical protein [Candidatus Pacearchaeota archaeon]